MKRVAFIHLWSGTAVTSSLLVVALLTWFHVDHRATLSSAVEEMNQTRKARIDLIHGFLNLSLSDSPGSPYNREEGLALVQQSMHDLLKMAENRDGLDEALLSELRRAIAEFEGYLTPDIEASGHDFSDITQARIALHQLDRMAEAVDRDIQERLDGLQRRLDWQFGIAVAAASTGLLLISLMVYFTVRAQQRTRERLAESEQRWQFAVEGAREGLWDWDARTQRVYFSSRWKSMLGYEDHEIGDSLDEWSSRLHPDDAEATLERVREHIEGRTPSYESEHRLRCKDGSYRWILDRGMVIKRGPKGEALRVIGTHADITEMKAMEDSLRESEERFRRLVEEAPEAIFIQTAGLFAYCNHACLDLYQATTPEQLIGTPVIERVHPDFREPVRARIKSLNQDRQAQSAAVHTMLRLDGGEISVEVSAIPFQYRGEHGALVFARDVTERVRAEQERAALQTELLQAQKMDSIGRLAGGVAHDFNNMLGVINGYTDILLDEMPESNPWRHELLEIRNAGKRAAHLTQQLLAFSRKQLLTPRVLNLNELVSQTQSMLKRLLNENIELITCCASDLGAVRADPGQLEQVIMNLAINARDAMPDGGKLLMETSNLELDASYAGRHVSLSPGSYVVLSITDTGMGMTPEQVGKIFEPFFTTKERGKGTGLGLSTAYGTVQQSGGTILVYSEPGHGTTFKVLLPRVDASVPAVAELAEPPVATGTGVILLVEDEESVRNMASRILVRAGYEVLQAGNGIEALELVRSSGRKVDLLLSDVIMPGMGGRELATQLVQEIPGIRVLFMTGYADNFVVENNLLEAGASVINKPFNINDLTRRVHETLTKRTQADG